MDLAVVRAAERRRTETPNAVMTTSVSPTLGGSAGLSLWSVEMTAGTAGPMHVVDSEQVWTVMDGSARIESDDTEVVLDAGDTAVLPAGVVRRITAQTALRALVAGHGAAVVSVPGEPAPRGTPPWIA